MLNVMSRTFASIVRVLSSHQKLWWRSFRNVYVYFIHKTKKNRREMKGGIEYRRKKEKSCAVSFRLIVVLTHSWGKFTLFMFLNGKTMLSDYSVSSWHKLWMQAKRYLYFTTVWNFILNVVLPRPVTSRSISRIHFSLDVRSTAVYWLAYISERSISLMSYWPAHRTLQRKP